MASMEQLSRLAKEVMNASVDAQFLGLVQVGAYLGMAFEEIVREAARQEEEAKSARSVTAEEEAVEVAGGR